MHIPRTIIFDIDGTIANIEHRRHHVTEKPKNWAAFNREIVNDTPFKDIIYLAQIFHSMGENVILCSGRGEEDRKVTEEQMRSFGVPYQKLYMRPEKDSRRDDIIKKELLDQIIADGYDVPFMVFDDRDQVVAMWRANGIRCMQVAPGNF